ncbi:MULTISPECIES: hypothetical protein [unclassified Spiroplasma]|uniref:hypothetical protein n=1 Tax=unclassified Spiroplasma TaxID=2637901 RepID=UPI0030D3F493
MIWHLQFTTQITKLSNNDNNKIRETYIQAYYTNDVKLKIRFSKILFIQLSGYCETNHTSWGNDKDITIDINNPNVLGIRNKSDSSVKIIIKPR